MKTIIGVWLDHEKAVLITFPKNDCHIEHIISGAERCTRMVGGSRSKVAYGPMDIADEHKAERRRHAKLNHYYDEIIDKLINAEKILIFGPGSAKLELEKEMKKLAKFHPEIVKIMTASKMTERQMIAMVRENFPNG
ncbi:hypothetical protein JW960_11205 [candidate division KSB1 bacterium]|nr:hypothetical protein [candidate division KSB1 bacterium]